MGPQNLTRPSQEERLKVRLEVRDVLAGAVLLRPKQTRKRARPAHQPQRRRRRSATRPTAPGDARQVGSLQHGSTGPVEQSGRSGSRCLAPERADRCQSVERLGEVRKDLTPSPLQRIYQPAQVVGLLRSATHGKCHYCWLCSLGRSLL